MKLSVACWKLFICLFRFNVPLNDPQMIFPRCTDFCLDVSMRECGITKSTWAKPLLPPNCSSCSPHHHHPLSKQLQSVPPFLLSFFCYFCCLEITLFYLFSLQSVLLWKIQTHIKVERITCERIKKPPCAYHLASAIINPWPILFHLPPPTLLTQPCPQIILK